MKHYFLLFLIAFFLCIEGKTLNAQSKNDNNSEIVDIQKQKNATYQFIIIPSANNTWCYDIIKDKKIFIHQTSIPGLAGNEGFKTKSDAEKVARLVIKKLNIGEIPPSVTIIELKELKVL